MNIEIREYRGGDVAEMVRIWNEVVEDGVAFPQEEYLTDLTGSEFFAAQTHTAVAADTDTGSVLGLYILHPNNIGRCGHIANASYAVSSSARGKGIGEQMVRHCLKQLAPHGFTGLQFNAVVKSNKAAIALYQKLGFEKIGIIPGGYRSENGYEDILIFFHEAE